MTNRIHRAAIAAAFAGAATFGASLVTARAADPVSDADRAFVAMVSQGGMFEVEAGKLAASQGSTQDIKDNGTTEAHDHELVGAKLKSFAEAAGIPMPSALNAQFEQKLDTLKALSGPAFDSAYVKVMSDIHDKDGAAFAKEGTGGTNPRLKLFALETHRIVVMHIGALKAIVPASEEAGK